MDEGGEPVLCDGYSTEFRDVNFYRYGEHNLVLVCTFLMLITGYPKNGPKVLTFGGVFERNNWDQPGAG